MRKSVKVIFPLIAGILVLWCGLSLADRMIGRGSHKAPLITDEATLKGLQKAGLITRREKRKIMKRQRRILRKIEIVRVIPRKGNNPLNTRDPINNTFVNGQVVWQAPDEVGQPQPAPAPTPTPTPTPTPPPTPTCEDDCSSIIASYAWDEPLPGQLDAWPDLKGTFTFDPCECCQHCGGDIQVLYLVDSEPIIFIDFNDCFYKVNGSSTPIVAQLNQTVTLDIVHRNCLKKLEGTDEWIVTLKCDSQGLTISSVVKVK